VQTLRKIGDPCGDECPVGILSIRLSQRIESRSKKGQARLTCGVRHQKSRKRIEELTRLQQTPYFGCDITSDVGRGVVYFVDDLRTAVDHHNDVLEIMAAAIVVVVRPLKASSFVARK
jgi:hypothetical protein